ncbi:PQQ-binding-like beta-propeller repeat protein [Motilimonas pumila]|uniref:Pyrrolo-quinoline quinone repeat domain-containing protein n=1 Tax=Motilimonas pumila TaxID=2303987 RepID=A0A418YIY8_9GAMM|nr:PQQ-binding-like beta-propeller repeat protein [Motilimonas pumila]RJG50600.1 hypothetical protein D1Z90_03770 [Motilimonas pumila]
MQKVAKLTLLSGLVAAVLSAPVLAASGDYLWSFKTQGQIWSSIKVANKTAYFGSDDGYFYAMNVNKTQLRWKFKTQGIVRSSATFHRNKVFFTSDDGYLYALNRHSGELIWQYDLNDGGAERNLPANYAPWDFDYTKSSPVSDGKMIYVGSADQHLYAIDARSGELVWKFQTSGKIRATADINQRSVFISSWDGKTYAIDKHTGQQQWVHQSQGGIVSDPKVLQDKVVIGSRDAHIYALDVYTGEEQWRYGNADGSWVESSAIAGETPDVFYIASSDAKRLSKFDLDSGTEIWHFSTQGWSWGKPVLAGDTVYIGATGADDYWTPVKPGFFAVDTQTGEQQWHYQPDSKSGTYVNGGVYGSVAVKHGKVFVPDVDGYMHVFEE